MLTRRLQVLIDEGRYSRLERQARQRGTSVATLVREAIDASFPQGIDRAAAAQLLLDAQPVPIDDWPVLKAEIEAGMERGG
jgi:16S rRNA U516 pseudouridylate synthase RsuA-like enzyme